MEMRKVHVHVHECFKAGDILKVEYMHKFSKCPVMSFML